MADTKITGLGALAEAPADGDLIEIVDVSDTTMGADGTNKKITKANFVSGLGGGGINAELTSTLEPGQAVSAFKVNTSGTTTQGATAGESTYIQCSSSNSYYLVQNNSGQGSWGYANYDTSLSCAMELSNDGTGSGMASILLFGNGSPEADGTTVQIHAGFIAVTVAASPTYYVSTADASTQTRTSIDAYSDRNILSVIFTAGTNAKFYTDGVLKATHTTNLPTGNTHSLWGIAVRNANLDTTTRKIIIVGLSAKIITA